jgi:ribosome-associated toxin RatA of RatAB toxin-antitoxin module
MRTENAAWFACPPDAAYRLACQVDRWPDLLPHYRWVRFHDGGPAEGGIVEMAARRPFGRRLAWPVWWVSRMVCDPERRTVRYTHIDGITRGMEVLWTVAPSYGGARVVVLHEWDGGPRFCGPAARPVARRVVGPVFIHHVAGQTLHHLAVEARKELSAWRGAGR